MNKKKAQLKIQAVYDLLSGTFVNFEVTPYTENDQSKAMDILLNAKSNDLVIRDLGYFVLRSFQAMISNSIHFVSRFKYHVSIMELLSQNEINLLKELRRKKFYDQWVYIGKTDKVKVRLIALPLNREVSNYRRRIAKNDRDKRLNHSKEYYELLGYNIFITSEPGDIYTPEQIAKIYGLRWRIESIFKCWKSFFNLQKIMPQNCSLNKYRVEVIIFMSLIMIIIFQTRLYNKMIKEVALQKNQVELSMLKLMQFFSRNISLIMNMRKDPLRSCLIYYCKYEKRKNRHNFIQNMCLS
jgi:IS4 transposase